MTHNFSRNIQHEVQLGKIDIGIVINPSPAVDLVTKKMAEDIVGVWVPRGVRFDDSRVVCDENLVQTQSILRRWKERPKNILSIQNLDLMVCMVEQGLGYGIIPARAVGLVTDSLKHRDDLPTYKDTIAYVHRPEFGKSPFERDLVKVLKTQW